MPVYDFDAALPALPLPGLNITAELIKEIAKPAAAPEDWPAVATAAAALKQQGLRLQERLKTRQLALGGNLSWLRGHWDDSLLATRQALPMTADATAAIRLHPETWGMHPLPAFILGMCKFIQRAAREDLPTETAAAAAAGNEIATAAAGDGTEATGQDGARQPQSMYSLRRMFTNRLPGRVHDALVPIAGSVPARVAVVHRGRWFLLTLSDAAGNCTTVNAVAQALDSIVEIAAKLPDQPAVGALTAAPRAEAAQLRDSLLENAENRASLAAIEDALFVVALNPTTKGAGFGADLLAGDAADRWFEKSLQVVYGPGEEFGLSVSTAGADAGFWLYGVAEIDKEISGRQLTGSPQAPVTIRSLSWRVDDSLRAEFDRLRYAHSARATGLEVVFENIRGAGAERIADCGCEVDVFVHLALLTAWCGLTGEVPSAAEIIPMRHFYQGRTETVRLATDPAIAFARALSGGGAGAAELRKLYNQAEAEYHGRAGHCRQGMGVEKHLFALARMAEAAGEALPDIFTNPGWLAATKNVLTIARSGSGAARHCAFPPAAADGLAVGYSTGGVGSLFMSVAGTAGGAVAPSRLAGAAANTIERMLALFAR